MSGVDKIADPRYVGEQYKDSANLNARIQLHQLFSVNKHGWHRWIFDQFDFSAHSRILEIGCGPGDLWCQNADRLQAGWVLVLSDFSPGMAQHAHQRLAGVGFTRFSVLDAQAIPFPDRQFDVVIANHMLYHVPDLDKALSEIRRMLKPDGVFFASTIGQHHLQEIADLPGKFDPRFEAWRERFEDTFTLENGAAKLERWFSRVSVRRYEDALVVTRAAPLVDYILSGRIKMADGQREAFTRFVEGELQRRGGTFYVTKDSGIFLAFF